MEREMRRRNNNKDNMKYSHKNQKFNPKKNFTFFSENKTSFEKRYYIIIPESSGKQREKKTDFVII